MNYLPIKTETFYYQHIFDSEDNLEAIRTFTVSQSSGKGLEEYLKLLSAPEDKLIEHYEEMGFTRLSAEKEKYVHSHVKPKYDDGCIFMYQIL
ncbi:MAG: hypothetical protein J5687_04240 [Treponema sp.]|nr:hypothetical protein [Treponema sp.]